MERLAQGLTGRLILASAPAGFGKTTLLSERLARCNCPAAWVSLDSADNDPARFLSYLIASLQKVAPGIGQAAQSLLHSPQLPPVESVLTALINDLCSLADHIILVLDDYHVIDAVSGSFGMIVAIAQEPLRVVG
jgi:LuxR family maltose regulon positive regulatory protein